jgi:hypothetical protein
MANYVGKIMPIWNGTTTWNGPVIDICTVTLRKSVGVLRGRSKKPYNQRLREMQKSEKVQK